MQLLKSLARRLGLSRETSLVRSPQPVRIVRARYDAAQTTDENTRLWSAADGYDADTCNSLAVRTILRNRARYVFSNNSRAKGMIRTLAKHTVGRGPTLQMQMGEGAQARKLSSRIEVAWLSWAKQVKLAKKLRILRIAKVISGEIFPVLTLNPKLAHDVKLDIQLVETDQVTNPTFEFDGEDIDGIFFDQYGNPEKYRILKTHPGGSYPTFADQDWDDISAAYCLHYFDEERPGQHRGIPEITPAVQLVEEARRFRSAVLGAAETAADFSMVMQSDAPADGTDPPSPMSTVELERRMLTTLPAGWKLAQTKAEQPTTTYKEFQREILAEVARCLEMPVSIATLDANDANMSSSYVINQPYHTAIDVERGDIEDAIIDPIFDRWLMMAFDPMGGDPVARRMPNAFPHSWYWPLIGEHADPGKVATAVDTRLKNRTTTYAKEYARLGLDWETEFEQIAKEKARMKELGIEEAEVVKALPAPTKPNNGDDDEEDDDTE